MKVNILWVIIVIWFKWKMIVCFYLIKKLKHLNLVINNLKNLSKNNLVKIIKIKIIMKNLQHHHLIYILAK